MDIVSSSKIEIGIVAVSIRKKIEIFNLFSHTISIY